MRDNPMINAQFQFGPTIPARFMNTQILHGNSHGFTFKQLTPSTTWAIKHQLHKYPSVTVVDSGESVVIGDVTYIDENNVMVNFEYAFSGKAYLN